MSNSCLIVINNILRDYIEEFPNYIVQGFEKLSELLPNIETTIKNFSQIEWINQENKIDFNDEETNINIQILIQPTYKDLKESIINITDNENVKDKYVVYIGSHGAGYSSDWLLEDAVFSANSMLTILTQTSWHENNSLESLPINIITPGNSAYWNKILSSLKGLETKLDRVRVFSFSSESSTNKDMEQFCRILYEKYQPVLVNDDILNCSQNIGILQLTDKNGSFYIFDEASGQSSLLALNGFNLVVDSGYKRAPEFWNFLQRLEKIDTYIMTSWNGTNLFGIESLLDFKSKDTKINDLSRPHLNYCILPVGPDPSVEKERVDCKSFLEINLEIEAQKILQQIKQLDIPLVQMSRNAKLINPHQLYFKLGQGCLDAYQLWPCSSETSGDTKRYIDEWKKESKMKSIYFDELVKDNSSAFLLIWNGSKVTLDSQTEETSVITRILISSSCHESHLLKSLEEFSKVNSCCNSFSGKIEEKKQANKNQNTSTNSSKDSSKGTSDKKEVKKILAVDKHKETTKADNNSKVSDKKQPISDKPIKGKPSDPAKISDRKDVIPTKTTSEKPKHSDNKAPSSKTAHKPADSIDNAKVTKKTDLSDAKTSSRKSTPDDKKIEAIESKKTTKKVAPVSKNTETIEIKKMLKSAAMPKEKSVETPENKKSIKKPLTNEKGSDNVEAKKTLKKPISSEKGSNLIETKKTANKTVASEKTSDVLDTKKNVKQSLVTDKSSEAPEAKKITKNLSSGDKVPEVTVAKQAPKKMPKDESFDSKKLAKKPEKSYDKPLLNKKPASAKPEPEKKKTKDSKSLPHKAPSKQVNLPTSDNKKDAKKIVADTTIMKVDLESDLEKNDVVGQPSISLNTDDTLNNIDTSELLGKMEEIGAISNQVENDQLLMTTERFDLQSTPLSDMITDSPEHPKTEEDVEALKTDALSIDQDLLMNNDEFPEDDKAVTSTHEDNENEDRHISISETQNIDNNIIEDNREMILDKDLAEYGVYEDVEYDTEHVLGLIINSENKMISKDLHQIDLLPDPNDVKPDRTEDNEFVESVNQKLNESADFDQGNEEANFKEKFEVDAKVSESFVDQEQIDLLNATNRSNDENKDIDMDSENFEFENLKKENENILIDIEKSIDKHLDEHMKSEDQVKGKHENEMHSYEEQGKAHEKDHLICEEEIKKSEHFDDKVEPEILDNLEHETEETENIDHEEGIEETKHFDDEREAGRLEHLEHETEEIKNFDQEEEIEETKHLDDEAEPEILDNLEHETEEIKHFDHEEIEEKKRFNDEAEPGILDHLEHETEETEHIDHEEEIEETKHFDDETEPETLEHLEHETEEIEHFDHEAEEIEHFDHEEIEEKKHFDDEAEPEILDHLEHETEETENIDHEKGIEETKHFNDEAEPEILDHLEHETEETENIDHEEGIEETKHFDDEAEPEILDHLEHETEETEHIDHEEEIEETKHFDDETEPETLEHMGHETEEIKHFDHEEIEETKHFDNEAEPGILDHLEHETEETEHIDREEEIEETKHFDEQAVALKMEHLDRNEERAEHSEDEHESEEEKLLTYDKEQKKEYVENEPEISRHLEHDPEIDDAKCFNVEAEPEIDENSECDSEKEHLEHEKVEKIEHLKLEIEQKEDEHSQHEVESETEHFGDEHFEHEEIENDKNWEEEGSTENEQNLSKEEENIKSEKKKDEYFIHEDEIDGIEHLKDKSELNKIHLEYKDEVEKEHMEHELEFDETEHFKNGEGIENAENFDNKVEHEDEQDKENNLEHEQTIDKIEHFENEETPETEDYLENEVENEKEHCGHNEIERTEYLGNQVEQEKVEHLEYESDTDILDYPNEPCIHEDEKYSDNEAEQKKEEYLDKKIDFTDTHQVPEDIQCSNDSDKEDNLEVKTERDISDYPNSQNIQDNKPEKNRMEHLEDEMDCIHRFSNTGATNEEPGQLLDKEIEKVIYEYHTDEQENEGSQISDVEIINDEIESLNEDKKMEDEINLQSSKYNEALDSELDFTESKDTDILVNNVHEENILSGDDTHDVLNTSHNYNVKNDVDILFKEHIALDNYDVTHSAPIYSENHQETDKCLPDSESNDSDLSVDIVKDHTTEIIDEPTQDNFHQPILDDIIEDFSPSSTFNEGLELSKSVDNYAPEKEGFDLEINEDNEFEDSSFDKNANITPDILRGLKHRNLSEPTEIEVEQKTIEDEELINYQITNISNSFKDSPEEADPFSSKNEFSTSPRREDSDQDLIGDEVHQSKTDENLDSVLNHENSFGYVNGNNSNQHIMDSDPMSHWNEPLSLPMPSLSATKPSAKPPLEKHASPLSASKLKSAQSAKVNGTSSNSASPVVHKATDSPKSATSPRGSINPKPSAPRCVPLTKGSTPKQTKKPEPIDHSKLAAFYMEVAYIPVDHDGNVNPERVTEAFFTRIRAKQYILPGLEHNVHVLDSLLSAKKKWSPNDNETEVRLVPVKLTDTLRQWAGQHAQELSQLNIKIGAAVEHSSVSLGGDSSAPCVAHRIDF